MADFAKEITDLFVKNPFLFNKNCMNTGDYLNHFFSKGCCSFKFPFFVKSQIFIDEFKNKLVQTVQFPIEGGVITISIFQISRDEHLFASYTFIDEKLVYAISLHAHDLERVPFWIEKLYKYSIEEKQRQLGFGQFS